MQSLGEQYEYNGKVAYCLKPISHVADSAAIQNHSSKMEFTMINI